MQNLSITPNRNLHPLRNNSQDPPLPSLWLPAVHFACLFMWLTCGCCHINGTTQYVSFGFCFQGPPMVDHASELHLPYGEIIFCFHLSVDGHLGCFRLLAIMSNMNTGVQVSVWVLVFNSLGIFPGVEFLGCMVIPYLL